MDKEKVKSFFKKNKKIILGGCAVALGVGVLVGVINSSDGEEITKVSTTFEGFIEKADLNVATFKYNVIAKKCKDNDKKCNKSSNDISDFEHVVACRGSLVVKYAVDEINYEKKDGKIIIDLPEPKIDKVEGVEVNSLNGDEHPASALPEVMKLCEEEIKSRGAADKKLIESSQNQAKVVLESFYKQLKNNNGEYYEIEFK